MNTAYVELPKFLAFALFLFLGIRIAGARTPDSRSRTVSLLIAQVLLVSGFVGVTQIDAWPFTSYTLAAFRPRPRVPVCTLDFYGVDSGGREWPVDPLSFSPVYLSIVQTWGELTYPALTKPQQREAMRFLVDRAESGRASLQATKRVGFERLLRGGWDRYWWLLPRHREVPSTPYIALRIYRTCGVPEDLLDHGGPLERRLIAEQSR